MARHLEGLKTYRNLSFGRVVAWFAFHPDSPIGHIPTGGYDTVGGCRQDRVKFIKRIMSGTFAEDALVQRNAAQHFAELYIVKRSSLGVFYDVQTLRRLIQDDFVNTPHVNEIDTFQIDDLVEARIHDDIRYDRGTTRQRMAALLVQQAFGDLGRTRIAKLAKALVRKTDSPLYSVSLKFGMPSERNDVPVRAFLDEAVNEQATPKAGGGRLAQIVDRVRAAMKVDPLLWGARTTMSYDERIGTIAQSMDIASAELANMLGEPATLQALGEEDPVAADFIGYPVSNAIVQSAKRLDDVFATRALEAEQEGIHGYYKIMAHIGNGMHVHPGTYASRYWHQHHNNYMGKVHAYIGAPPTPRMGIA